MYPFGIETECRGERILKGTKQEESSKRGSQKTSKAKRKEIFEKNGRKHETWKKRPRGKQGFS